LHQRNQQSQQPMRSMVFNQFQRPVATRNSRHNRGGDSSDKKQLDFSALDKMDQQPRPFIEAPAPENLNHSISAPADKPLLNLNYPIDADNDDVLMGPLEALGAPDASAPATAGNQGFPLAEDTETELKQMKISRSENWLEHRRYVPLAKNQRQPMYPSYGKWPSQLEKHADDFMNGRVPVKNTADTLKTVTPNYSLDVNGTGSKYLLQLSCLPRDCGVRTLRELFPDDIEVFSVHLVVSEQTAVVRFNDEEQLKRALKDARAKWNPQRIDDSQYLQFGDGEILWQYQDSNRWIACHPAMGKLIESMPPGSFQLIRHESRQYFIEKYNETMGQQTNYKSGNQRSIRRVNIKVWAQHADEDEEEESKVDQDDAMMAWMGMETAPSKSCHSSSPSNEIVLDRKDYDNWKLLTVDDDQWEMMVSECRMEDENEEDKEKMSGVWDWDGDEFVAPNAPGLNQREDVYVMLDADEAEELFKYGKFGGDDKTSMAKRVNVTVCESMERAVELFDGDCDADGNVKIFMCNVWLDENQEEQLDEDENCNMTDVHHIHLSLCCSINLSLLKTNFE